MNFDSMIRKNFIIIFFSDLSIILVSLYLAFLLRFDFNFGTAQYNSFIEIIAPVIIIKLFSFSIFKLYKGMWRYASIQDLFNVIKASILSFLLILTYILAVYRFDGFSRSVIIIDFLLTILFIAGFRLSVRFYFEYFARHNGLFDSISSIFSHNSTNNQSRLLIIGAGDAGEQILREIKGNTKFQYLVVGFLDDQTAKIGKNIHGVNVLGKIETLVNIIEEYGVDEILIAIPSTSAKNMRRIVDLCKTSDTKFKTIPGMSELINGHLTISSIREVAYRDLLGRKTIKLDNQEIGDYLTNKTILVTGAGGSIGSELCRQICKFKPEKVVLFERSEPALYEIELELRKNYPYIDVIPTLADIQNKNHINRVFNNHNPEIVFHAAAYKHVPMMELHPWMAVSNNIVGTINVAEIAKKYNVDRFVFVSTDKAVRPTNVMGTSKRITELFIQNQMNLDNTKTKFMTVRFGNVIGSSGSVIPLFKKQIAEGGPVTVTHPDIIRYFMTIPEACQLILQAGSMTKGGECYILDMGDPVNIDNMARDLIKFSGFEADVDIDIVYTGLRPGEKLFEELIIEGEGIIKTDHKDIMVLKSTDNDLSILNYNIDILAGLAEIQDAEGIIVKMKEMVPEFRPENLSKINSEITSNNVIPLRQ
jgi:FlaA1/EpsC-like NDP-sugar epimerase